MATDFSQSMSTYGTSYKRATLFFSPSIKKQVFLLYAFVREVDNIVDTPTPASTTTETLEHFYVQTKACYTNTNKSSSPLITEFCTLCHTTNIPRERIDAFFDAMKADCSKKTYHTYEELQTYMYGSAEVIGLMMGKIIGMEEKGIPYAKKLGEAMQYTNFLRDVKEDYQQYGRIYLPQERLANIGLSHDDIIAYCTWAPLSNKRNQFLQWEVSFTRSLYTESKEWIRYLNTQGRLPVYLSAALYEAILDRIETYDYNIFDYDAHTTRLQKARIVVEKSTWRLRKKYSYA